VPYGTLWLWYHASAWLGSQVAHGPAPVRAVAAQWTTTGRLSVWAQGQLALREPLLAAWVAQILPAGAARVAASPPLVPAPVLVDTQPPSCRRRAA
jgi:hypothetical protein